MRGPYFGESSVVGSSPLTAVTTNFLRALRGPSPGLLHRLLVAGTIDRQARLRRHLLGDVDEEAVGVVQLERVLAADDVRPVALRPVRRLR